MPKIGLDFDAVVHSGDDRDIHISGDPVPGVIEFIVRKHDKYRLAIISDRLWKFGSKRKMQDWLRIHLKKWAHNPDNLEYLKIHDRQLAMIYNIRSGHHRVAKARADAVDHWVERVISKLKWSRWCWNTSMLIDDRSLIMSGIWPE